MLQGSSLNLARMHRVPCQSCEGINMQGLDYCRFSLQTKASLQDT